jgi:hypothetical protein
MGQNQDRGYHYLKASSYILSQSSDTASIYLQKLVDKFQIKLVESILEAQIRDAKNEYQELW